LDLTALEPAALDRCRAVLTDEERDRAARFAFPVNRLEYEAAHGLLRQELAAELAATWGGGPADLVFGAPLEGSKPVLEWPRVPGLDFNISHTTGMVACAIAWNCAVGIDLEPLDRRVQISIAQRFFAPQEYAWLMALDDAAREPAFLQLWTLKEAVAKAVGRGLQLGFETFSVHPQPPRLTALPSEAGSLADWTLRQWQPAPGHLAAVAVRGQDGAPPPVFDIVPGRISLE